MVSMKNGDIEGNTETSKRKNGNHKREKDGHNRTKKHETLNQC